MEFILRDEFDERGLDFAKTFLVCSSYFSKHSENSKIKSKHEDVYQIEENDNFSKAEHLFEEMEHVDSIEKLEIIFRDNFVNTPGVKVTIKFNFLYQGKYCDFRGLGVYLDQECIQLVNRIGKNCFEVELSSCALQRFEKNVLCIQNNIIKKLGNLKEYCEGKITIGDYSLKTVYEGETFYFCDYQIGDSVKYKNGDVI